MSSSIVLGRRAAAAALGAACAALLAASAVGAQTACDLGSRLAEFLAGRSPEPVVRIDLPPSPALCALAAEPDVRADFSIASGETAAGTNAVTVTLTRAGATLQRSVVNARVWTSRSVVVTARALRSGETIGAADVAVEPREVSAPRGDTLADAKLAVGQRVRRSLASGEPVRGVWLELAPSVKRGDRVTLRLARGGLTIEAPGRAEEDGAPGDWIRVRNAASNRELTGRVAADGVVHVEM